MRPLVLLAAVLSITLVAFSEPAPVFAAAETGIIAGADDPAPRGEGIKRTLRFLIDIAVYLIVELLGHLTDDGEPLPPPPPPPPPTPIESVGTAFAPEREPAPDCALAAAPATRGGTDTHRFIDGVKRFVRMLIYMLSVFENLPDDYGSGPPPPTHTTPGPLPAPSPVGTLA